MSLGRQLCVPLARAEPAGGRSSSHRVGSGGVKEAFCQAGKENITSGHIWAMTVSRGVLSFLLTQFFISDTLGQGPTPVYLQSPPTQLPFLSLCGQFSSRGSPTGRTWLLGEDLCGRRPRHPATLERGADTSPSLLSLEGEMGRGIHITPECPLWAQQALPSLISLLAAHPSVPCQPGLLTRSEVATACQPLSICHTSDGHHLIWGAPPHHHHQHHKPTAAPRAPSHSPPSWVNPGCHPPFQTALSPATLSPHPHTQHR